MCTCIWKSYSEGTQKMPLKLLVVGESGPSLFGLWLDELLHFNLNFILHFEANSLQNLVRKYFDVLMMVLAL